MARMENPGQRQTDPRRQQFSRSRPELKDDPGLEEWVAFWWTGLAVAEATRRRYASMLANHILPCFGATPLSQLSRTEIRAWAVGLGRRYRPSTVASIAALLTGILAEAVREGILASNPALRLRAAGQHRTRRTILTAGEVETIAERLGGGYGLLVLTAAYTGMRWSELAGLQRSSLVLAPRCDEEAVQFIPYIQIDPDTGALQRAHGSAVLGPPKSAAAGRDVHLPAFLTAMLTAHLTAVPGAFVFTARHGGHLHTSNFRSRVWRPAIASLADSGRIPRVRDLEAMTFHHLRHTHKTWMAEHHTPPSLQDYRMGHVPRSIQGRYEHHTHAMITELVQDLENRHAAAELMFARPTWQSASMLCCRRPVSQLRCSPAGFDDHCHRRRQGGERRPGQ